VNITESSFPQPVGFWMFDDVFGGTDLSGENGSIYLLVDIL